MSLDKSDAEKSCKKGFANFFPDTYDNNQQHHQK